MIDIEGEIRTLIFGKYQDENHFLSTDERKHLILCREVRIDKADVNWECLCYSEYTRDDEMTMVALITCPHGVEDNFTWGRYSDMPDLLKELYRNTELNETPKCAYEKDD